MAALTVNFGESALLHRHVLEVGHDIANIPHYIVITSALIATLTVSGIPIRTACLLFIFATMSDADPVAPTPPADTPAAPTPEEDTSAPAALDESVAPSEGESRPRCQGRHGRHGAGPRRKAAMACGLALLLTLAVALPSVFFMKRTHRMHRRALRDLLLLQAGSGKAGGGPLADAVLLAGATEKKLDGNEYVLRVPKEVLEGVEAASAGKRSDGTRKEFANELAAALVDGRGDLESVLRMIGVDTKGVPGMIGGGKGWGKRRRFGRRRHGKHRHGRGHGRGRKRGRRGGCDGGRGRCGGGRGRRGRRRRRDFDGEDTDQAEAADNALEDVVEGAEAGTEKLKEEL